MPARGDGSGIIDFSRRVDEIATALDDPSAELLNALEELRVAEEELRAQNEELVEAHVAIESQRSRYQDLFEFAPEPYLVTDANGTVREANRAIADLLGLSPALVIGKPLAAFVWPPERPAFRKLLTALLRGGSLRDQVIPIMPRDEEPRHVSITAAVAPGKERHVRWILSDITRRVNLERELHDLNAELDSRVVERTEQLERANLAKDTFLGMISHELRTPITTIGGNAEVLRRIGDKLSKADFDTALEDIETDSRRLQRLIDDLLVLARVSSGSESSMEPLLPERVARRVTDRAARDLGRVIVLESEPDLPVVAGDETFFEQVLRNLISNAAKYSPSGSQVDVTLAREADRVAVRVLDRGAGINIEELAKVFDPFYRSTMTASGVEGAGIGLAVCRRLVEAQGGTIWVLAREGGGTEFGFALMIDDE